ncbi:DUF5011 domain-containing protein [Wenyingzhuangia sp. 1_MG-2023]|nr:DUF5011 domain-containing protein [Wenyingzhuangia sp. 1_MG-2023]
MLFLSSCEQDLDTEGVSRITNYPTMELIGESNVFLEVGETYTDEGVIAKEGEDEIDVLVKYNSGEYYGESTLNTDVPDKYAITYIAENADGIKLESNLRNVWVFNTGDLVNSIEGLYVSNVKRGTADFSGDLKYVLISKTGDNTYEITHAIGGHYSIGLGYGSDYAARGAIITANDISSNDFSISQAVFPLWGNVVDITDFTVDASAKTISFVGNGDFANSMFTVNLTQVQP